MVDGCHGCHTVFSQHQQGRASFLPVAVSRSTIAPLFSRSSRVSTSPNVLAAINAVPLQVSRSTLAPCFSSSQMHSASPKAVAALRAVFPLCDVPSLHNLTGQQQLESFYSKCTTVWELGSISSNSCWRQASCPLSAAATRAFASRSDVRLLIEGIARASCRSCLPRVVRVCSNYARGVNISASSSIKSKQSLGSEAAIPGTF